MPRHVARRQERLEEPVVHHELFIIQNQQGLVARPGIAQDVTMIRSSLQSICAFWISGGVRDLRQYGAAHMWRIARVIVWSDGIQRYAVWERRIVASYLGEYVPRHRSRQPCVV